MQRVAPSVTNEGKGHVGTEMMPDCFPEVLRSWGNWLI